MPRETQKAREARMARAEASLVINCPADRVFAYLADILKGPEWQSELLDVQQTSSGPVGVGTTIKEIRRLLGRNLETAFTITDYQPDFALGFKSTSGQIPMTARYTLLGDADRTTVTITVEAELTGVFRMTEPLVVHTAKKQMDADMAKLKEILES